MCTAPQNLYVPGGGRHRRGAPVLRRVRRAAGRRHRPAHRRRRQGRRAARRHGQRPGARQRGVARVDRRGCRLVASCSTLVASPTRRGPTPSSARPGLVAVDVSARGRLHAGVLRAGRLPHPHGVDGAVARAARDTVREHGAMTAAVYSTSEQVLDAARDAAAEGGVALSREPHRPDLRQPDGGLLRPPRHRREPGRERRLHRRRLRREPIPRHHVAPTRLTHPHFSRRAPIKTNGEAA